MNEKDVKKKKRKNIIRRLNKESEWYNHEIEWNERWDEIENNGRRMKKKKEIK